MSGCEVWNLKVPGELDWSPVCLDIETEKVTLPSPLKMPNGELLRRRWAVTTVGMAVRGKIKIIDGEELAVLGEVRRQLRDETEIQYAATREFDEMILRGRFTNARRAHLPAPRFPALSGAEQIRWKNLGRLPPVKRGTDVESRDVPAARRDGRWCDVMVHNLRDVCELILAGANPDAAVARWCREILMSRAAADDAFGW